jgi:integrase
VRGVAGTVHSNVNLRRRYGETRHRKRRYRHAPARRPRVRHSVSGSWQTSLRQARPRVGRLDRSRAEQELADTLALVRKGLWRQPTPAAKTLPEETTFHEFASQWFAAREAEGLAAKTLADLKWSLSNHLLSFFADHMLYEITAQEIDRYKVTKAKERQAIEEQRAIAKAKGERFKERGLSNGSINHTLRHLAQILETAVEYELIPSNPATGRRRRLKATKPARPWVEPEQLMAFLANPPNRVGQVLLAILAGAGLRIGEALALRWRDVDLGTGTLYVRDSKTPKGRS